MVVYACEELHERILTRSRYHHEQIVTRNRMSRGSLNFDELYLRGYWELEVQERALSDSRIKLKLANFVGHNY